MKIEFTYSEVVDFLSSYNMFSLKPNERTRVLFENGVIDSDDVALAKKQEFNLEIKDAYIISPLIINKYLEHEVEVITGNSIEIIDHKDEDIHGLACNACNYVVFESKEDAFFEVCPVCGWQNDGSDPNDHSSANKTVMHEYIKSMEFKKLISEGEGMYKRVNVPLIP
ncbi:Uncharacterised protein [Serratia entomophila]|uniref:CPCC family cysteine-rich protein n=1 Tax=Serratia entomophila TaxID=42906 RepID=UPI00217BDB1F|nr:CPCC family cysteine-rich protein [Serratia entomophila]CAI2116733.1 Uncharacterised protein [Serratia entomophila]